MRQILLLAFLVIGLAVTGASAEALRKWEVGLGAAAWGFPDYRGPNQQRGYLLPLPLIQYRGKVVQIDRDGAYGDVFALDYRQARCQCQCRTAGQNLAG